jgi:hypothetical protein
LRVERAFVDFYRRINMDDGSRKLHVRLAQAMTDVHHCAPRAAMPSCRPRRAGIAEPYEV